MIQINHRRSNRMDLRTTWVLLLSLLVLSSSVSANFVFQVHNKFKGKERSLSALRDHDHRRHRRILSGVDLELGGNGLPSETGLYYAKIGLGSPSVDYYVQVDTGSDILWVNCVGCEKCPKSSNLGIDLTLYDPKSSTTSKMVTCEQDFCTSTYDGRLLPGCRPELLCQYNVVYGDGSSTSGYFVNDTVHLSSVNGNRQTTTTNGSIVFGCGAKQSGELGTSSEALDGILGFGQANSSMLSQLAIAGKVRKEFAHCLDTVHGGGIFTIGDVVEPRVKTTPLVQNMAHYNVIMKAIEVGGDVLQLPSDTFDSGDGRGTIIDSGTTLAYLPDVVYESLMAKVMARQPGLKLHTVEGDFTCFQFSSNVDEGFPVVKLHFDGSLTLTAYPHEYLFQIRTDVWCIGWQNSGMQTRDGKEMTLLGDMLLSNKLVIYDLVNQEIGWMDYNCSSTIKIKDESTGTVYSVGSHNLSSVSDLMIGRILTFFLLLVAMLHSFML